MNVRDARMTALAERTGTNLRFLIGRVEGELVTAEKVNLVRAINEIASTAPASDGAGLANYTMGTVVTGSTTAVNAPAADSSNNAVSAEFAMPAAGWYVLGVVSTAAAAASSHLHISGLLQMRYS